MTLYNRILSKGLPAILFLASLGLFYANLLIGARRFAHDTFILHHPIQAYLSDSLAQGVFPFWDPFSSPGVSTAMLSFYSPLLIAFGWLLPYSREVMVLEFMCFGLIGMVGTYQWLKYQSLPIPLALVGAIAYVGSAPYLHEEYQFAVQLTAAFIPWVFFSVDLLSSEVRRREALKGTVFLVFSVWLMMTGGYMGLNYMTFLFVGIYVLANLIMNRAVIKQTLQFGALAVILSLALLFLPLSEMLSFVEHKVASRQGDPLVPYLGSIELDGPLSLVLTNGVYHPGMITTARLMYMGVILGVAIPAGFITVGLKKKDALFLGLAVLIILASMGSFSPVAVFFVRYVPGFSLFSWHAFNSILVVLLLIALSLRLFARFQIQALERPELRRRYALVAIVSLVLVFLTAATLMISKSSVPFTVKPTWYDLVTTAIAFLLSTSLLGWFFFFRHHTFYTQNIRTRIYAMSAFLLILIFVVVIFLRFFPPHLALNFIKVLNVSQRGVEHILQFGLPAVADILDARFLSMSAWEMFSVDIILLGIIVGIFALWILFDRRPPHQLNWALIVFVLADMLLAAQRYEQGSTYYIVGQMSRHTINRPASISYTKNDRDPNLTYVSLVDWKPVRSYENLAVQLRRPTFMSYGPFVNYDIFDLMKQAGGVDVFSKLVWLVPKTNDISIGTWKNEAIEPDIQALSLQPNRLEVVVNTPRPARLVWTDSWAEGWSVSLNGVSTVLHRVLGVLKGVDIPSGKSQVIFSYKPAYYSVGIVLAIGGLLGLGIIAACIGASWLRDKERSPSCEK